MPSKTHGLRGLQGHHLAGQLSCLQALYAVAAPRASSNLLTALLGATVAASATAIFQCRSTSAGLPLEACERHRSTSC